MLKIKNRKVINYKPEYFKEVLYSDDKPINESINKRNHLKIKLNNSFTNEYSFIFINPSKAHSDTSDDTINIVIKFCHTNCEIGIVNIFNVYPFYEPDACDLHLAIAKLSEDEYNKEMLLNLRIIEDNIKKSDKVVVGWGEKPKGIPMEKYRQETDKVLSQLRLNHKVHCFETNLGILSKAKFPFHPIRKTLKTIVEYPIN